MTEIPEHLLKRAAERRAAKGGGGDKPADAPATPAAGATPAASSAPVPSKAKATAPLPTLGAAEAKATPDIPVVAAAKRRKRVPYWAAAVVVLLPVWGFIYANAVKPAPGGAVDPVALGAEVFAVTGGCAGCHMGDGAGGANGAQLTEGRPLDSFPDPLSMVHWVGYGSADANPDGSYGAANHVHPGNMAGFKDSLSPEEIASVVIYIRSTFSADLYDPEAEMGFTAEGFEADPDALVAQVEEALALPAGPPDVSEIARPDAG